MSEANRCGADLDVAMKLLEAGYLKNLPREVTEQRLKEQERRGCEWRLRQKEVDEGQKVQGTLNQPEGSPPSSVTSPWSSWPSWLFPGLPGTTAWDLLT